MINTNVNGYLQYEGIGKLNTLQNEESQATTEVDSSPNEAISLNISASSKSMLAIEDLSSRLTEIFGTKKDLSPEELEKEEELISEIDKINEQAELPYSESDLNTIKEIRLEIEQTLNKSFYSFDDDEKIYDLTKEIDYISNKYGSPTLSEDNIEAGIKLKEELHDLQGYNNPSTTELIEAEKIFATINIMKSEMKLNELDVNSSSYSVDKQNLEDEISVSTEKMDSLAKSQGRYEEEETRENAKSSIRESLSNINAIKNSFYNGETDFTGLSALTYSDSSSTEQTENKWLDFLQDSRKESYVGNTELDSEEQENYELQKFIDRINTLHE